jgi:hypothetical protein
MTAFPRCLLIVTAEVDEAVAADWNTWYDTVHLPDALACPGVLRGKRCVTDRIVSESNRGTTARVQRRVYTTVYELSGPEAIETKEFAAMRGWARFAPHVQSETRVITAV